MLATWIRRESKRRESSRSSPSSKRSLPSPTGGHSRGQSAAVSAPTLTPLNNTNFQTENLFGVWIAQGLDDPEHNFPYLLQGGLGMPDRDYYLSNDPKMAELRKQYQTHVAASLKLAGLSDARTRANRVFALEMKIAGVHARRGLTRQKCVTRQNGRRTSWPPRLPVSTGPRSWRLPT